MPATRPSTKGDAHLEVKRFASADECEAWFEAEHARSPGIWLEIAKAGRGASVTYAEAIDVALCFGWIDGRKEAKDDRAWRQKFTPRAARSRWSKINCEKAERLAAAGKMRPAGRRAVDQAKADGRWDAAYDSPRSAEVPPDLARALRDAPKAAAFFETIAGHNRYAILYRVQEAKKPETRARRIATYVAMLAEGKTIHPESRAAAKAKK